MNRGIVGIEVAPGAVAEAPGSGVRFGTGQGGPVAVRLFRITGTRIVVASRVLPAQLLTVRATAAGVPVQVVTSRVQLWEPLLRGIAGCRVLPDAGGLQPTGGPGLIVDDRPGEGRTPIEIRPWQCRIDVRTQWSPAELSGFARYDLAVFGAVAPEAVRPVTAAFGLPRGTAEPMTRLDSASFAMLRRAHIDFVSLDPTAAEAQVLERARGFGSASARVVT